MKLYLIVAKGKHQGMPILLKVDLFLMGSAPQCQLRSSLPGIAAQHCAVVTRGERVFVRDLGGGQTLVNGELVPAEAEWPLHNDDHLEVGPLEFVVQYHEKHSPDRASDHWGESALHHDAGEENEIDDAAAARLGSNPDDNVATASAAAASILSKIRHQRGIAKGRLRLVVHGDIHMIRFNDSHIVEEPDIIHLRKELYELTGHVGRRYLWDFKAVHRMSSAGVEMIQDMCHHARDNRCQVAFCRIRPEIRAIMETLGLLPGIVYFPDKESALMARW